MFTLRLEYQVKIPSGVEMQRHINTSCPLISRLLTLKYGRPAGPPAPSTLYGTWRTTELLACYTPPRVDVRETFTQWRPARLSAVFKSAVVRAGNSNERGRARCQR